MITRDQIDKANLDQLKALLFIAIDECIGWKKERDAYRQVAIDYVSGFDTRPLEQLPAIVDKDVQQILKQNT